MTVNYILDGKNVVKEPDLIKWAEWMAKADRTVKKDIGTIRIGGKNMGNVAISTVFLGIDHGFGDNKEPVLFETMVFGGELDGYQDRCSTWEAAEKMHELACEKVKLSVKCMEF